MLRKKQITKKESIVSRCFQGILNATSQYGKKRRLIVFFFLFFLAGTAFALIISQDFLINYSKLVGSAYNKFTNNDGSLVLQGFGVESLGGTSMSGGDYDISVGADDTALSKLETNLDKAHCYPNPFKPNSGLGHRIITFSRLTDYTKLKVFNIAGEMVYETEANTPRGELAWNVVNNSGESLASGVFIYLIMNNNGHKKIGKFAVLR
ncbi:MAG: T9SS type A sorting domain-containing protein [Elusimicrobia bacterium]|nr:T9SS type A sorting domain-containing protein [Elusimicrobiota bacterium]